MSFLKNKFFYYILFFVITSLFILACKKDKKQVERKENPISVLVAAPIKQSLNEYLDLSAEIKAIKEVEISPDVPGKVANILKYEGSFVNKGDTIALIDRFVIGANYAYAPARTPISGYVTTTYVAVGASVAANTPIANVADISKLEVEIQVPERAINGIALGQKVFIRVPSSPNNEIEAIINKRDYAVNPSTRTLMVKALINNDKKLLLPGMFSDVSILLNSADNVFVLPNSAIFSDELGKTYIYVVKEDDSNIPKDGNAIEANTTKQYRAYNREVNILFTSKDKVALSSGLTEGEEVVMFGREFLRDGSLINRIENDPTILEYITPNTNNSKTTTTNNTSTKKESNDVKVKEVKKVETPIKKESSTNLTKVVKTEKVISTNNSIVENNITSITNESIDSVSKTNNSSVSTNDNSIYTVGGQ